MCEDLSWTARVTVKDGEQITDVLEIDPTSPYAIVGFVAECISHRMYQTDNTFTIEINPVR